MLSLRAHVWICVGLLLALIVIPILGNAWAASGGVMPDGLKLPFMIFYLALFVAFGLSAIPVMVKVVLGRQQANADIEPIGMLIRNQDRIVWAMWIVILAGLAVALPAMIHAGFFAPPKP